MRIRIVHILETDNYNAVSCIPNGIYAKFILRLHLNNELTDSTNIVYILNCTNILEFIIHSWLNNVCYVADGDLKLLNNNM